MDLKNQIDTDRLPRHVAVIMDGNGRWAKEKGRPRVFGHHSGVKSVREVTEAAAELGVEYLTLYAFSTENWGRPKFEVNALMTLLVNTIRTEIKTLMKNDVKLNAIGELAQLPKQCHKELLEAIEKTKDNKRMTLTLALNYSAKWEIIEAVKEISSAVKNGELEVNAIDNATIDAALSTSGIPDPELMIRTSGETRISNFLLWQLAYAELYFTPVFWPDFHREEFYKAILNFQNRERRFGKTSEQITE
ncbi:MAG: undecaprenyl diphosphate synthase [Cognaticolwellia sp.]|jgi:undecaprenyl diphosphate synthase